MAKKELFITEVENLLSETGKTLSDEAMTYLEALKATGGETEKPKFTENGKLVLQFMQANKDSFGNMFSAAKTGEAMGISSKTVSGACRKLVTDGYLEKIGTSPVIYTLSDKGIEEKIDAE